METTEIGTYAMVALTVGLIIYIWRMRQSNIANSQDDPVIQGVELTFKLLEDLLSKEAIRVIDPLGEPFDPNLHEAMSMVEHSEMEPNSVFAVVQKGYTLNERLVRPAMVMVTKAPIVE